MEKRKLFALLIALILVCMSTVCAAEGTGRVITVNLDSATDAELADAAAQIQAEQKARQKTEVKVKSISLGSNKIEVMAGDTFTPDVRFKPEDATNKAVTMTSSDEKVVRVGENGQLEAVYAGKATVTVTAVDGGKTAKLNVTVTKKLGKYDGELTFQGLEWGSDYKTAYKKLAEDGLVEDREPYAYNSIYLHFWPENELLFANFDSWYGLPVAFRDRDIGAAEVNLDLQKKIGGYIPQNAELCFLNGVGADGKVDPEKTELYGVYLYFDRKIENSAQMFVDLLSKLEAQYGEFTKYMAKDMTRKYNKDIYTVIKNSMEGAKLYSYRELGRDLYLMDEAICTLHGKNNTGILLMIDSSGNVTLFYGKTNSLEQIRGIQRILEALPDDKGDAGL